MRVSCLRVREESALQGDGLTIQARSDGFHSKHRADLHCQLLCQVGQTATRRHPIHLSLP